MGLGFAMSLEETFTNLAAFLNSLDAEGEQKFELSHSLVIICPDWEAMLSAYAAGGYSFDDLRLATFGAQEYEGDTHFNMYTPDSLTRLLEGAGFTLVNVREKGRRNGACFEMEVEAVK